MTEHCILWPLERAELARTTDAAVYVLRVTANGVTENLNFPSLTSGRAYWMSGDAQADSSAGNADLVELLQTCLITHSELTALNTSVSLSSDNTITISVTGFNFDLLWAHANTTLSAIPFGWAQSTASGSSAGGSLYRLIATTQTYGIFQPAVEYETDSREDAQQVIRGAASISGLQRVANLGPAAALRTLTYALMPDANALTEYAAAGEPTNTAENLFNVLAVGRPCRVYEDATSRTSTSYDPYYLKLDQDSKYNGRGDLITRDERWRLRWAFRLPLRSSSPAAGGGSAITGGAVLSSGTTTPGGSSPQVQYNNSGAFGGAANAEVLSGNLALVETTAPTASTDRIIQWAVQRARQTMMLTPELGPAYPIGPAPWARSHKSILTVPGGSNVNTTGALITQTANTRGTLATTNLRTSTERYSLTTTTGDNAHQIIRTTNAFCWRGNAAGLGGFHFVTRYAPNNGLAGNGWCFFGLTDTVPSASQDPLAGTPVSNMVGFGIARGAGGNLDRCTDAASGTPTLTDLGANFAVSSTTAIFELHLFAEPNGSVIYWYAEEITTGNTASGSFSTNLPGSTAFLYAVLYQIGNGVNTPDAASTADWMGGYVEAFGA